MMNKPISDRFNQKSEVNHIAVIFSSHLSAESDGYEQMAEEVLNLATSQPGFIGAETVRDEGGFGITVSYWENERCVRNWKKVTEHLVAQKMGMEKWYNHYRIRVCKIKRNYFGP